MSRSPQTQEPEGDILVDDVNFAVDTDEFAEFENKEEDPRVDTSILTNQLSNTDVQVKQNHRRKNVSSKNSSDDEIGIPEELCDHKNKQGMSSKKHQQYLTQQPAPFFDSHMNLDNENILDETCQKNENND